MNEKKPVSQESGSLNPQEGYSEATQKIHNEILQRVVKQKSEEAIKVAAEENKIPLAIRVEDAERAARQMYPQEKKPVNEEVDTKGIPSSEPRTSRRGFLKWFVGAGAGLAGAEAGRRFIDNELPSSEQIDSEFPNMVHIDTPEAGYSVVYSQHDTKNNPETLRNADAALLEYIAPSYLSGRDENLSRNLISEGRRDAIEREDSNFNRQYGDLIKLARQERKPIFLVDISIEGFAKKVDKDLIEKNVIRNIETVLGLTAASYSGYKTYGVAKKKEISRRDFLKTGVALGVSAYLMTPSLEEVFRKKSTNNITEEPNEHDFDRKASRVLHGFNKNIHPETYDGKLKLDLRNKLMAQKSETVARLLHRELGRKPSANIYVGSSHTGIEKELVVDRSIRLNELHQEFGDELKDEKLIVRIDFKKDDAGREIMEIKFINDSSFE